MNKNYFNYLIKSKKTAITFIGVLYVLTYLVSLFFFDSRINEVDALAAVSVIGVILSVALVPIMFNYVHNKKAVDTFFALPISRKQQVITTEVFINLVISVPVVVLTLSSLVLSIISNHDTNILAYVLFILAYATSIVTLVLFNTATYLQAYSLFDGIVMIFAYLAIPLLVTLTIMNFVNSYIYGINDINLDSFMNLTSIVYACGNLLISIADGFNRSSISCEYLFNDLACIIVYLTISIIVVKKDFVDRSVEKAENVSNKFSAYPFLINFFTFCILFINSSLLIDDYSEEFFIFFALIFVLYEIANCVYRRKIKIVIKDVLLFVLSVLLALSIGYVSHITMGFGLSKQYLKNPENVRYNLYQYYHDKDINKDIYNLISKKYETPSYFNVSIEVAIPKNKMSDSKEIINYFENMREDLIDKHYEGDYINRSIYRGSLNIYNNLHEDQFGIVGDIIEPNTIQYYYDYNSIIDFSIDDLKLMNKYGNVFISFESNIDWIEVTLDELLED